MSTNNSRLCECGCGKTTNLDPKGQPRRYLHGHGRRNKGKGWMEHGYRKIRIDGRRIAYHRWVKEKELGRRLFSDVVVHHVDADKLNNDPANLVLLSRAEHTRLHRSGKKGRNATKEERGRVIYLRESGMTIQQVANATGRPFSTVSRWITKAA